MRRIGVLTALPADDPEWQSRLAAFHQGLQELGWIVGRNIRIDYARNGRRRPAAPARRGAGRARAGCHRGHWHLDRGAIAAGNPHSADRVPASSDPVGAGFVDSLARPGGNATGFTQSNMA